jgi:glycosyltransferase involved in cell wall biosynthesis
VLPKLSIVTPSFNQVQYIEETLHSVRKQGCREVEHLIMDGASTDGTVDLLKRYSSTPGWEYVHWISESDRGQSDAINKGFRKATGGIIGWLNSDDLFEAGSFSAVLAVFDAHPEIDFVYGDYRIMDSAGKTIILKREIDFDWNIMLCGLNYIAQPNVFFRRRVFDKLGYLNESLHYVMDYEFWLRAASNGFRFHHVAQTLAACRWHLDAKTVSRDPRIEKELRSVRQQYWNKHRFHNRFVQNTYERFWNVRVRASRQWSKLRTRHAMDIVPASWYLELWKRRSASGA